MDRSCIKVNIKNFKRKKIIITVSIIVIIVLIAVLGGVLIKMRGEQKQMSALPTGEFLPGIHAINCDFVNMFLIECDGGSYIAIDAGANKDSVAKGLSQSGISSDDVSAVLMTHTHGDHTAGLSLFDKAVVYGLKESVVDQTVSDGETISINGKTIQVIATPGHADDSVCYLINGEYLFAGDNMSLVNGKVGLFNSVYNKSDGQQKSDIAKLSELSGVRYVITAHYGFAETPVYSE